MAEKKEKQMAAHHMVNGVATDLLVHIDMVIEDTGKGVPYWAEHLSKTCNISVERATELINHHLG